MVEYKTEDSFNVSTEEGYEKYVTFVTKKEVEEMRIDIEGKLNALIQCFYCKQHKRKKCWMEWWEVQSCKKNKKMLKEVAEAVAYMNATPAQRRKMRKR